MLVSHSPGDEGMVQGHQFRKVLPVSQTVLAVFFGGWGALASKLCSEPPFLGEFHWLGLHSAISLLAVAV